jgi:hypothetical protein
MDDGNNDRTFKGSRKKILSMDGQKISVKRPKCPLRPNDQYKPK